MLFIRLHWDLIRTISRDTISGLSPSRYAIETRLLFLI